MDIHDEIVNDLQDNLQEVWEKYNSARFFSRYLEDVLEAQTMLATAMENRDVIRRLS